MDSKSTRGRAHTSEALRHSETSQINQTGPRVRNLTAEKTHDFTQTVDSYMETILNSFKQTSSAYQEALLAMETLHTLENKHSAAETNSEKTRLLLDIEMLEKRINESENEVRSLQENVSNCQAQINSLTIERGKYAREVKNLVAEINKLKTLNRNNLEIAKQNKILTIDRGKYARKHKNAESASVLAHEKLDQIQKIVIDKNNDLSKCNEIISSQSRIISNIEKSKKYQLALLISNNSKTFSDSFSLLWKIPKFIFSNR